MHIQWNIYNNKNVIIQDNAAEDGLREQLRFKRFYVHHSCNIPLLVSVSTYIFLVLSFIETWKCCNIFLLVCVLSYMKFFHETYGTQQQTLIKLCSVTSMSDHSKILSHFCHLVISHIPVVTVSFFLRSNTSLRIVTGCFIRTWAK